MILAAHTFGPAFPRPASVPARRLRAALSRLRGVRRREDHPADALVRALCHDMRGSLTCLESALHRLDGEGSDRTHLLAMARAQAAHLGSMLRTAEAARPTAPQDPPARRSLGEVLETSLAASGLPRRQLTLRLAGCAADVVVGDARLQRILVNLLENAHRHGDGRPVTLVATCADGWVDLAVTQPGVPAAVVAAHLHRIRPPADLTGLGLWSVQRQARELGGRVVCEDGDGVMTLRVLVPDR